MNSSIADQVEICLDDVEMFEDNSPLRAICTVALLHDGEVLQVIPKAVLIQPWARERLLQLSQAVDIQLHLEIYRIFNTEVEQRCRKQRRTSKQI